ncbi:nitrogen fixation negative regulator NifL [Neiella marina]|uniref:histidine kinase n=1 Tax=Neiella holothuriorum TaxID=2870530 RepID=A0ABS7EHY5_9GAMM|nr:nitrogen fixation negative regulator NifL [Neiella holothuriorum]MBW8191964.1 nitrogen fixation negative regulator NifL [Neiella holothuriorum]
MTKSFTVPAASGRTLESEAGPASSLNQMVQIVEQAPMAISISDMKANIVYVNEGFSRITGYEVDEVVGCNHSILSYRTTPSQVYQSLWSAITAGECWQGRLINRRKSGERYLADVTISPLRDDLGEITHFMGMHRDVTETHAMNTRLNNQNTVVEAVLNAAPVAIALLDEKHNVVLDNLAYKALAADFDNEPAYEVLTRLKQQLGVDAIRKLMTANYAEGHSVSVDMKRQQDQRWFSCRVSSLSVDDGDVDGYFTPKPQPHLILAISEYTREKRHIERQRISELQRSTAESEMMHAMQETLHAAIHQMQGPINMIEAAVTMMCRTTKQCPGMDAMEDALRTGAESVEQLKLALPERASEATQPVNVNQLIHDISAMATERLLARSIPLQLSLMATLPSINGQPSRLRVALKQLLDNAIDAIDFSKSSQRQILISSFLDHDEVVITFDDSGPGVDKSRKLKIFQPFVSTKPATSSGCRGIGLSIVQQVINEHSGTIDIQESDFGGCCARLVIPKRGQMAERGASFISNAVMGEGGDV